MAYKQDYLQRQIEQFCQMLAKIAGMRSAGDLEAALDLVRQCYRGLGLDASYLRLDAKSLRTLLADQAKLLALCDLLDEESRIHAALGNEKVAHEYRNRAEQLRVELRR